MVLPLSLQVTISFNVLVYTRMEQKQEQTKRDGFILKLGGSVLVVDVCTDIRHRQGLPEKAA